ncbi:MULTISPECIES: 2Fe-2S iron-sulfur cluster-binding protein [Bartonella]|uniref:2Fe-2S iron-sulfur cluster-binding protein n=1 Tax=Bartonella TaxID=773 RepID=UPI00098F387C|nr:MULTISPECIES: 2Fe-2S iron-sulfur cluster-binding protein [Bartonella]MBH9975356.1 (2Fe-2S)-binding protein [Bartonella choladocola]MBI0014963.1 (2Fe-2S)-binding protein [Bartonella sp. B10834G3]MBI0140539.1 (2Fe-2S)-binding protein [Bartonella choladocola]
MVQICFVNTREQQQFVVDSPSGLTLMEAALGNNVPGIVAECGGACSCATCHVYIDENWLSRVGDPNPMEDDMLDFAYDRRENSRLSCQITLDESLDGLVVYIPERQG